MKTVCVLLLLVVGTSATQVTPVQKVVQMLSDMAAKGKKEMQEEQVRFASFAQFCEGAEKEKVASVAANKETIGALSSEIDHLDLEIEQLAADIAKADSDIAGLGSKLKALDSALQDIGAKEEVITEERTEEHDLFEKKDSDLGESVDALDRAVAEMKTQDVQHAQSSLMQVMSLKSVPAKDKKVVAAFLQRDPEVSLLQRSGPSADAYEFQSEGIVTMFSDLENKMEDERGDGQKGEMNQKHSYQMMMQQLTGQMDKTKDERARDARDKAAKEQASADAKGAKAATEQALAEDEKYLAELRLMCKTKTAEFESRQALRQGEQEAIGKAVEVLSGGSVSGAADKHLPGLLQKHTSFVQLRNSAVSPLQTRVAAFLKERASQVNSAVLYQIAARTGDDAFTKVKKMIRDMIQKLMEEANEEAEHKGWCDTELTTNQQTRDSKTSESDSLSAEIETMTATISKLTADITQLTEGIATIDKAMAEATADREAEKAKNTETIADAKAASAAVSQATAVLKEFYAKAAEATVFAQAAGPADDAPATFDGAYQGNQGQASGVMGMLEVIQTDFSRLESETAADEAEAADLFSKYGSDSATNKAVKETDIKMKTTKKQNTANSLAAAKKDLAATQAELTAANDYYDKLKPSCVDAGVSYEDRVARREAEIQSLQEAVKILGGDDIAV